MSLQPQDLVFWSAALGTFVASVMAEEQRERVIKGAFGAIAGASLGGLAALFGNDDQLLLVGVLGSTVGAAAGWLVYLLLSLVASSERGALLVDYQMKGLKGVRARLDFNARTVLLSALNSWSLHFSRLVVQDRNFLVTRTKSEQTNQIIQNTLHNWMATATDTLNLVLYSLGKREGLQSRSTIILFDEDGKGGHWISYAGGLKEHKTGKPFGTDSIAYKVAKGNLENPYFAPIEAINKKGESREGEERQVGSTPSTEEIEAISKKGESRVGEERQVGSTPGNEEKTYSAFVVFRLNDSSVLSVDWPGSVSEEDEFVRSVKYLYQLYVCPAIADALEHWEGPLRARYPLEPRLPKEPAPPDAAPLPRDGNRKPRSSPDTGEGQ